MTENLLLSESHQSARIDYHQRRLITDTQKSSYTELLKKLQIEWKLRINFGIAFCTVSVLNTKRTHHMTTGFGAKLNFFQLKGGIG